MNKMIDDEPMDDGAIEEEEAAAGRELSAMLVSASCGRLVVVVVRW